MKNAYHHLNLLRSHYRGQEDGEEDGAFEGYFFEPEEETLSYAANFLNKLEQIAAQRFRILSKTSEESQPLDWSLETFTSKDGMNAWAFLFPPENGGAPPDVDALSAAVAKQGILYGVDETVLHTLLKEDLYFKLVRIAHGLPSEDGKSGKIIDHVSREKPEHVFAADDDATADYKNLGHYTKINEGDLICELQPPTDPIPGVAVTGVPINGKPGEIPSMPKGKNTRLSEDKKQLLADVSGQIVFRSGLFCIDQITTIEGSVCASTGNLDVNGDLIVHGDVFDGFTVKATGNIQINGAVESADIKAGGNIIIRQGVNGNKSGILRSRGAVTSKFLENVTVYAAVSVKAEYMVNCTVSCNGTVEALSGKGAIIGGQIAALHSVHAKTIGSPSHNISTTITLGATMELLKEQSQMDQDMRSLKKEINELEKNISYLESLPQIPLQHINTYHAQRMKVAAVKAKYSILNSRSLKIEEKLDSLDKCFIDCNKMYPSTTVIIGSHRYTVDKNTEFCRVYLGNDGIVVGVK